MSSGAGLRSSRNGRGAWPVVCAAWPSPAASPPVRGPVLGRAIALAFLPPDVDVGAPVEIDVRGRLLPAEVVKLPFVKKAA